MKLLKILSIFSLIYWILISIGCKINLTFFEILQLPPRGEKWRHELASFKLWALGIYKNG